MQIFLGVIEPAGEPPLVSELQPPTCHGVPMRLGVTAAGTAHWRCAAGHCRKVKSWKLFLRESNLAVEEHRVHLACEVAEVLAAVPQASGSAARAEVALTPPRAEAVSLTPSAPPAASPATPSSARAARSTREEPTLRQWGYIVIIARRLGLNMEEITREIVTKDQASRWIEEHH